MSTAKKHAEWLSLIDISGPFLSIEVLAREFPQGLDVQETALRAELSAAYDEWRENQESNNPEPAIHNSWIDYVIDTMLEHPDVVIATGQAIPADLKLVSREYGEVRPQIVIHQPDEPSQARLLVLAYPYHQPLERQVHGSASAASPATQMMELLHATNVRLGLVTNGEQWMLVHAKPGETTSFISWYADLWIKEKITQQAFVSLLGVHRFFGMTDDKTLEALMAESAKAQHEVTDQLGYQVREAVEILIQAIDRIDKSRNRELLVDVDEKGLYEAALTVMMRLVFLMSAEERELLLLGDQIYDQHYAVTTLRAQLREIADLHGEEILERRFDAWSRLLAVFRAVHGGIQHEDLRLPPYGGSLFDPDRFPFLEGRPSGTHWRTSNAVPLTIDNRTTLHLLEALQILRVKLPGGGMAEARRLSFRALSVTQIGHVYEGLLDHEARRATDYVLGFAGVKHNDAEIPLSTLEALPSRAALEKFLVAETGRSESALHNGLNNTPDQEAIRRLRIVCGADDDLFERVRPYLNLMREDDRGKPYLIFPGGMYVTKGATRRETGTHYTPELLTKPIVQHTLEPLVYRGPAEGWAENEWQLKSPTELLDLKICDMAMGSGAFLVQVVEYLSDRLLEAWGAIMEDNPDVPAITPEGRPSRGRPEETLIPRDNELERKIIAKRLVADRCIYGVDKNPLAVEMAKLSLWLVTLSKGRAFNFLDHALKCGDSLVGVDLEQLRYWNLHPEGQDEMFVGSLLQPILDFAIEKRRQLESFTVMNIGDQHAKAQLYAEAEAATAYLKTAADHLIAEAMGISEGSILPEVVATFNAIEAAPDIVAALLEYPLTAPDALDLIPFHWQLEFPEVFQRGGFDGFIGNPPFMGGGLISDTFGRAYRKFLVNIIAFGKRGSADYCTYFFLNGVRYLNNDGNLGLISTNTISQGDTREVGLEQITQQGIIIYRAVTSAPWPGDANLEVAHIYITKHYWNGKFVLNETIVNGGITSYLSETKGILGSPKKLMSNQGISFKGHNIYGMGFVLEISEAQRIIKEDSKYRDVLFPLLNAQDINQRPDHSPSRWVINFHNWSYEQARQYEKCFEITRQKVKPERDSNKRKSRRENWWLFGDYAIGLMNATKEMKYLIATPVVSKYVNFVFVPTDCVCSHRLVLFSSESLSFFSVVQSSCHNWWAREYSSTLETRINYSPSDCFETFPFPSDISPLENIGQHYYNKRREIMLNRQEGLTDTYNRFHDPDERAEDIQHLRDLHVEMDVAVTTAYGWDDVDLGHGFHETDDGVRFTISEVARREMLTRLLRLNHERYAEECHAGLHTAKECAKFFAEHPEYVQSSAEVQPQFKEAKRVPDYDEYPEQEDMFEDDNPQPKLF